MKKIQGIKKYIAFLLICVILTPSLSVSQAYAKLSEPKESIEIQKEDGIQENADISNEETELLKNIDTNDGEIPDEVINEEAQQEKKATNNTEVVQEEEEESKNNPKENLSDIEDNKSQETEIQYVEGEVEQDLEDSTTQDTVEVKEIESIDKLSEEVSSLYSDVDMDSTRTYVTKTLIVTADNPEFEKYEAITVINFDGIYILQYETEDATKNAYKKLKKDEAISSVEVDALVEAQTKNKDEVIESSTDKSELALFLDSKEQKNEVKVAILDTGIDVSKEVFQDRVIDLNINLSSSGDENSIQDDNAHGTSMGEIIVKNTSNTVKIMPIKIANESGKATILNTYLGIKLAIENHADIINISMGTITSNSSAILATIISEAVSQNIIVVAAAGNDNANAAKYTPANVDSVITVSATDENGVITSFSNHGDNIDYSAIGEDGTSTAAANVSAIIAMLKSMNTDYSLQDIHDILQKYAIDLGEEGFDKQYGNGFISLKSLVNIENRDTNKEENSIFDDIDWKSMDNNEFNDLLFDSEQYMVGEFLSNLNQEELGLALSKSEYLNNTTYISTYDEEGNLSGQEEMICYQYCLNEYDKVKEELQTYGSGNPKNDEAKFAKESATINVNISSSDGAFSSQNKVTLKGKSGKSLKTYSIWLNDDVDALTELTMSTTAEHDDKTTDLKFGIAEKAWSFGIYIKKGDYKDSYDKSSNVRQAGVVFQIKYKNQIGYQLKSVSGQYPVAMFSGLNTNGKGSAGSKSVPLWDFGSNEEANYTGTSKSSNANSEKAFNQSEPKIWIVGDLQEIIDKKPTISIQYTPISYLQSVDVSYQNPDGGFGAPERKKSKSVPYGKYFSWSEPETSVFGKAVINPNNYRVEGEKVNPVQVWRKSNVSVNAKTNINPTTSGWYKGLPTVTFTGNDPNLYISSVTVNGVPSNGASVSRGTKEGANTFSYFATNVNGVRNNRDAQITINADNSAPYNLSMTPNTKEWTNQPIQITAKATDTYSGVATIELQYKKNKKDSNWTTYETNPLEGENQANSQFLVRDNGYYRMVVTDRVGFQTVTNDANIIEITNYDPNLPDSNTIGVDRNTIQWVDEPTGVEVTSYGSDELSGLSTVEVWEQNESGNFYPKEIKEYGGEKTIESANYDTHINECYLTKITDQAGNALMMKEEEALEVDNIDPQAPDITTKPLSKVDGYVSTKEGFVIQAVVADNQSGVSNIALQKLNEKEEWEDYKTEYQIISEEDKELEKKLLSSLQEKDNNQIFRLAAANLSIANKKAKEEVREQGEEEVIIAYTIRENGTYRLRGADLVQNTAYTDVIEITNLDGSTPEIQVEGNPTIWQNTDATIKVIATDADSAITKMTLDGEEKAFKEKDGAFYFTFDATKNQEFSVTATDEAGNTTTEIIAVTKIDKEAPDLTTDIKKSWLSMLFHDSRNLSVHTADSLSGIKSVVVEYEGKETTLAEYAYEKAKKIYQGNYKIRQEGKYSVVVTDHAGNVTTQTIAEANLDFSAPFLKVEGNPTIWQNTDATIKVIATDEDSKIVAMTLDGEEQPFSENEKGEFYFTFTVTKNQTFMVSAQDEAGNLTSQKILVTKIDKELPTLQLNPASAWADGNRKLNYSGVDTQSGISQIIVEHEGVKEVLTSFAYEKEQKDTSNTYPIVANGDYVLTIKDHAGNVSKQTISEAEAKILKAIEVVVPPDKTKYHETEDFKKKGMVVDAIYNDNSRKLDIKDYVILNGSNLPLAQAHIDLSYTEDGVTVYTDTPIKVYEKGEIIPQDPGEDGPEQPEQPLPTEPKVPITPTPTPVTPTIEQDDSNHLDSGEDESLMKVKKDNPKTVKQNEEVSNKKSPIGLLLAGAGLLLIVLFLLLANVKVYSKDEDGEWKFLGKTRAMKSKELYKVKISKFLRIRATSNSYKLVFSKMFKRFHEECDLIIKVDKMEYKSYLEKDSDTVYIEHKG